ncbi:MAG: hypothetical protein NTV15_00040, partial [Candidatus Bathyarchaeota archaeon]|nr:hypothetical protein [Candidatus Bathyarchaeota archaeon]
MSHRIHVAASITVIEYLFDCSPYMNNIFTIPNNNRDKEKNTLIARIATTSSVAFTSRYEYQFQI